VVSVSVFKSEQDGVSGQLVCKGGSVVTRQAAYARLVVSLSGSAVVGTALCGSRGVDGRPLHEMGCNGDREEAHQLARKMMVRSTNSVTEDGENVRALLAWATSDAKHIVGNNSQAVRVLAAEVKKRGELNRAQIDAVLAEKRLNPQAIELGGLHWLAEHDEKQDAATSACADEDTVTTYERQLKRLEGLLEEPVGLLQKLIARGLGGGVLGRLAREPVALGVEEVLPA